MGHITSARCPQPHQVWLSRKVFKGFMQIPGKLEISGAFRELWERPTIPNAHSLSKSSQKPPIQRQYEVPGFRPGGPRPAAQPPSSEPFTVESRSFSGHCSESSVLHSLEPESENRRESMLQSNNGCAESATGQGTRRGGKWAKTRRL